MPAQTASPPATAAPAASPAAASVKVKPQEPAHEADETKPAVKVERAAESKPQAKPEHDDARAAAILDGNDGNAKPSADKKAGKFVVQVAALASEEKVTELQGKLTEAGFKSYVQKVPTDAGVRIRVRVGPFGSKDEAESARVKLGKLGFSGKLMPS
jgi:DedD protein